MRGVLIAAILMAACRGTPPAKPSPPQPLSRAAYAHYLAGKMAMYQRDWGAATVSLEAARAAAPDEPMIVVELARAQTKARDPGGAKVTLEAARKRWPNHGELWVVSGDLAAADAATHRAAAAMYRRAIELAPDDERGYLGLARIEPANAEQTLRTLVARVPTSVDGHYRLAIQLARRDELGEAIAELRRVLERDPDHIDARLDLARALTWTGKLDEAVVQTRSAFDRAAQPLDVAEELFWLLVEVDDRMGALDLLTLLDDDRSDLEALAVIARLERGLGRLDEATAIGEKIARQDAEAGAVVLAEVVYAAGDARAALELLAAVPEDSAHAVAARKSAANIYLAIGEPAKVAPLFAKPKTAIDVALLVALAAVDQRQGAQALQLLASFGDVPDAQYARARVHERTGDRKSAIAILEKLVAAEPDVAGPRNLLGNLYLEDKRLAEARVQLLRARQLSPGDPAVLDSWALLLLREGATAQAIRAFAKAHRYAPREPEILVHLAEAWLADQAPRTATRLLAEARALQPSPAVIRQIERLEQAIPPSR